MFKSMENESNKEKIDEILKFWFEEVTPKQKFTKDLKFDALVISKFEKIYS